MTMVDGVGASVVMGGCCDDEGCLASTVVVNSVG